MHESAEWGVAAHFSYKQGTDSGDSDWLNRIIDWQSEISDPNQFMADLKSDLEQEEVFVFTPKGRVVTLPVNSTPVDFAYAVHTEVGHSCVGARVNGRLVSLDVRLSSGDTCEIFTSKVEDAAPSRDWLGFVQSARARTKIKGWFTRERREDMVESGRDELTAEFRREGLPVQKIWTSDAFVQELEALNMVDLETLQHDGLLSAEEAADRVPASERVNFAAVRAFKLERLGRASARLSAGDLAAYRAQAPWPETPVWSSAATSRRTPRWPSSVILRVRLFPCDAGRTAVVSEPTPPPAMKSPADLIGSGWCAEVTPSPRSGPRTAANGP
jgi:hypothetical protein